MSDLVAGLRDLFDTVVRAIIAVPAACLPRHYWKELDTRIPVTRAALPSALATFFLAPTLAIPAFFRIAEANAERAVEIMLQGTGWRPVPPGVTPPSDDAIRVAWLIAYQSLPIFLMTPLGVLTLYLAVTGAFRAMCVPFDDTRGDPVLTVVDAAVRRLRRRTAVRRAREAREALEGREVPDVLVHGSAVGFPTADFVVIASRRKSLWDAGAVIVTSDKWFRLGTPTDREMPGGLRTLYPLTEHHDLEIPRRGVTYELPRLSGGRKPVEQSRHPA